MQKMLISLILVGILTFTGLLTYAERVDALQDLYVKNPKVFSFISDEKDLGNLINSWDIDVATDIAIKYKSPMMVELIVSSLETDAAKDKFLFAIQESKIFNTQDYNTMKIKMIVSRIDNFGLAPGRDAGRVARILTMLPTDILIDSIETGNPIITEQMVKDEITRRSLSIKRKELGGEPILESIDGVIVNKLREFKNIVQADISERNIGALEEKIALPRRDQTGDVRGGR